MVINILRGIKRIGVVLWPDADAPVAAVKVYPMGLQGPITYTLQVKEVGAEQRRQGGS